VNLIEARNWQPLRQQKPLFEPLDWQVQGGQFWLLAGANGCGKSTLLDTLAGLHPEYRGALRLAGKSLTAWASRARARQVSYLPQNEEASPDCRVIEAVQMGSYAWGQVNEKWRQEVIQTLGLGELLHRSLAHLSGGQRRAVELATSLIQDSPLLLLDEPLNQFDLAFRLRVLEFLRRQNHKAIVMASHDLILAPQYASHALLIFPDGHTRQGEIADMMKRDQLAALLDWPPTDALDRLWKNQNP